MKFKDTLNESASTNKKIKAELDHYLGDVTDVKQHYFDLKEILNAALRDANFSDLIPAVDKVFSRAQNSEIKDWSVLFTNKGEEIATMAKWDANIILDGIAFYASLKLGGPLGKKITELKDLV
jgi:hypothetical protein